MNLTAYFKLQNIEDILNPISIKYPETIVQDFNYIHSYISDRWGRINIYEHKATKRKLYIDRRGHTYSEQEKKLQPYEALLNSVGDYYMVTK